MKRDFTKLLDVTVEECTHILDRAAFMKSARKQGRAHTPLSGRTLAMIFEKPSTRTRISFEVGMGELGGRAIFLSQGATQMGRGEPIRDTARVLSRYVHAIMIRTYGQDTVDELARWSTVPVVNGLTDLYHPCQILADLFTVREYKGRLEDVRIAWIGDGNNMANSWIEASLLFGFRLALAVPPAYGPHEPLVRQAKEKGTLSLHTDPYEAVRSADVVNTDVWISMGMEAEKEERKSAFSSFRIDGDLMKAAGKDAIVLHCLPAHRGQEITDEVFERFQDVIFTQAENRLHAQKALLEWLMTMEGVNG